MLNIVFIPLFVVAYWYLNYLWYNRRLKSFSGPIPLPVVGSALDFINPKNTIAQILKFQEKYKGDFKLFLGFRPTVFISEIKSVEALLNSTVNLRKPREYRFLKNWLGNGLLLSDGDYWRKHRKIITQTFHFQILEKYVEVFDGVSNVLVECLDDKVDGPAFDIYPYINLCTLDIMCEATMGTSVNALRNSESQYVQSVKHMGRIVIDRFFSVFQKYDIIYGFSKNYRIEKEALLLLHNYTYNVIKQRKQENVDIISENDLSSKKRMAFIDLLLYHGLKTKLLNDQEIREEVDTILAEGHDTTSSGISFALYNLANNPNIQKQAYEEIKTIFSDNTTRAATYNDLKDMKYLEMVIKESLRLYPSVPIYARELTTDIRCGNKIFPKGMFVAVNTIGIHRDRDLFPNPNKFDPERFSPENSKDRSPYAFVPFSAGSRNCIGQKFAMLEMKCVISKILRHYQLFPATPAQKLELLLESILRSRNGIMIGLKKR